MLNGSGFLQGQMNVLRIILTCSQKSKARESMTSYIITIVQCPTTGNCLAKPLYVVKQKLLDSNKQQATRRVRQAAKSGEKRADTKTETGRGENQRQYSRIHYL